MDVATLLFETMPERGLAQLGFGAIPGSQLVMLLLVVGVLAVLMLSTFRRFRGRGRRPQSSVREQYARLQREPEVRQDVEQVMLELDQLARQIHGRIDTRIAKLEALIADADRRIERLSRVVRQARGDTSLEITLDAEEPYARVGEPGDAAEGRHANVYHLADTGLAVGEIAQETGMASGEIELILALRKAKNESCASASGSSPTLHS